MNDNIQSATSQEASTSAYDEIKDLVKTLIQVVVVVLFIRWSLLEPFKIPSTSMVPTLEVGDHILVNKLSYGIWLPLPFMKKAAYLYSQPKRGDVVVFTRVDDPETSEDESKNNIIKRVIGLPGEKLEVLGTKVLINDKPLDEAWGRWVLGGKQDFKPVIVPEGHILLLGDNRDQSLDSRYWSDPFLPLERVKGRAFIIYWNSEISWRNLKRVLSIIR